MKKDKALFFAQTALHSLRISFFDIEFIEILDIFSGNDESTDKIRWNSIYTAGQWVSGPGYYLITCFREEKIKPQQKGTAQLQSGCGVPFPWCVVTSWTSELPCVASGMCGRVYVQANGHVTI